MKFGAQLRTMRAARGLSQKELAKLTGIPDTYISGMETGKTLPNPDWKKKLREALGWDEYTDKAFEILEREAEEEPA